MRIAFVRILTLAVFAAPAGFSANILLSGNSMSNSPTMLANLALLSGSNTFTFVAPNSLPSTPLGGYDLVWMDGFSQFLDLSTLTPYLNGGGRVLVQNPGVGSESLSQYPGGSNLGISYDSPPGNPNVHILVPGDFVNFGLTDSGLSGWGPSSYGHFTTVSGGFIALTDDGTPGEVVTVRDAGGPGVLVYTQQGISQYLQNNSVTAGAPQLRFVQNLLPDTSAPEPGTLALLMVPFVVMALRRKRAQGRGCSLTVVISAARCRPR